MKQLALLWDTLDTGVRFVLAMPAALLPRRWWPDLQPRVPVSAAVIPSAIASFLLAGLIGIPAYFEFLFANRDFGPLIFFLFVSTPVGMFCAYLAVTGAFRGAAAALGDKYGDPVLSAVDAVLHRALGARRERRRHELRERLEGPVVRDRILSGAAAGIPDAVFVVVASRQKPDWSQGTFVAAADQWYRIGAPIQRDTPGGLRTLYPLFTAGELDVIRRSVQYDWPVG